MGLVRDIDGKKGNDWIYYGTVPDNSVNGALHTIHVNVNRMRFVGESEIGAKVTNCTVDTEAFDTLITAWKTNHPHEWIGSQDKNTMMEVITNLHGPDKSDASTSKKFSTLPYSVTNENPS